MRLLPPSLRLSHRFPTDHHLWKSENPSFDWFNFFQLKKLQNLAQMVLHVPNMLGLGVKRLIQTFLFQMRHDYAERSPVFLFNCSNSPKTPWVPNQHRRPRSAGLRPKTRTGSERCHHLVGKTYLVETCWNNFLKDVYPMSSIDFYDLWQMSELSMSKKIGFGLRLPIILLLECCYTTFKLGPLQMQMHWQISTSIDEMGLGMVKVNFPLWGKSNS